ncbi:MULTISPECIES: DNA-methyltransferase [Mesoplasma]|uniref:Methyltransferase n=1 Tax=Mesoplasma florum TaxID=2151 RepID=A0A2R3P7B0_MESFO|nr:MULTISPECIES: site-specific DNA-methyltransferase [Mesoplasma]AVN64351.1 site-specific DNA-methyltransferase [Mesoplasma florum]
MEKKINKILFGDSIQEMKKMPEKVFDFIFADPPYFMQLDYNKKLLRANGEEFKGVDDDWDKFESMEKYEKWTKEWVKEVKRVMKDEGLFCVISGMQSIYEIGNILKKEGFWIVNDIIWLKSNPTPNFKGTRLNNSHETMLLVQKSNKNKFTFNYKTGKFLNNNKQMGSVWNIPISSGNERLKDEFGKKVHSTQKPELLLYRLITIFTKKGDLILDPFGGTMTTAAVAKKTGRNFVTIEREKKYIKYGEKRLDLIEPEISDVTQNTFDLKPLKVSFEQLINEAYLFLNENMYDSKGTKCFSLKDKKGKVSYKNEIWSIHEAIGNFKGKKNRINAFENVFVLRQGKLKSLYEIREEFRKKYNKN